MSIFRTVAAKPGMRTVISLSPVGIPRKRKTPSEVDTVFVEVLVASVRSVTSAPGTAALVASSTTPSTADAVDCGA